jgi:hypothetical protein
MDKLPSESNIEEVLACYGIAAENNDPEIFESYKEAQKIIGKSFHVRIHYKESLK